MDRTDKAIIGYIAIAVLLAGPAYVQSENSEARAKAKCLADNASGVNSPKLRCEFMAGAEERTLPKVLAWPMWLSYVAAKKLST